jgi:uncharacterized protein (TIGR03437 family)
VRLNLFPLFFFLIAPLLPAQPVPVILVDGYHLTCDSANTSAGTFGDLQTRLQALNLPVFYLNTCTSGNNRPSIEQLGQSLGQLINSTNAPQVDVVGYSLGALVARSYLAGKQDASGVFNPPANPKVRKLVLIASPNFGALFGGPLAQFAPDIQARELLPGSQFLFDLDTWNQNRDDLREVDAIGILGNAGGIPGLTGASDGVVSVTSASLLFARSDDRTRVVPYCHTDNSLAVLLGLGCSNPPIAKVDSDTQLTWQIIKSFLTDTPAWRTIGHPPSADPYLSTAGGVMVAYKTADDNFDPNPPSTPSVNGLSLTLGTGSIYYRDFIPNAVPKGTYSVSIIKPGPRVDFVAPAAALLPSLLLAPNTYASIYGAGLSNATITVSTAPVPATFTSDHQINAVLPRDINGYTTLTATTSAGKSSIRFLTTPSAPAIFSLDASGTGAAAAIIATDGTVITSTRPARRGEFVSLYLTGLGSSKTAVVSVGGVNAQVTFAGPSPNYPGVDQINFIVPDGVTANPANLTVMAGGRTSNTVTLAVSN